MRENVSIIFASIIAVFLLIVMPLFSIMSRQDSIAYNKALTLTTEFVDSVRTKGYFTEVEYSKYISELGATNNTYKVNLECHNRMLIKDVNSEEEDTFVEDTLVYYNSDIMEKLENREIVNFNVNDEFYIKLHNTNITTASLLFNYFSGTRVVQKVINMAYGGRIFDVATGEYQKTKFDSTYSPVISFGDILNLNNEALKKSYEERIGDKVIIRYYSTFDISEPKNKTLSVGFEMKNFQKIGEIEAKDFNERLSDVISKIEENVKVSGKVASYDASIREGKYENGKITGIIDITNIVFEDTVERTDGNIIISQGLGEGSTGIKSLEARTYDFILLTRVYNPKISITLEREEIINGVNRPIFNVELNDLIGTLTSQNITLFNEATNQEISKSDYDVNITEVVNSKTYNVAITLHQNIFDQALFDKWSEMIKVKITGKANDMTSGGESQGQIDIIGEYSHPFSGTTRHDVSITKLEANANEKDEYGFRSYNHYYNYTYPEPYWNGPFIWKGKTIHCMATVIKNTNFLNMSESRLEELARSYYSAMNIELQLQTKNSSTADFIPYPVNIETKYAGKTVNTSNVMYIYVDITVMSIPEVFDAYLNRAVLLFNGSNDIVNRKQYELFSDYNLDNVRVASNIPIPSGFVKSEKDNNLYITDSNQNKYKWLWCSNTADLEACQESIRASINKYKGFYISVNSVGNYILNAENNLYADREDIFTYISFKPEYFGATLKTPYYYLKGRDVYDSNGIKKGDYRFVPAAYYYTALFVK